MELKTKIVKSAELKNIIIKRLYFDKALSCAELSEILDKSIPSISKSVNELIEEGFVVEQGYAPSSGGRRPLMYALNPKAMYIVAVAMDQLSTRIQMVDLLNNPVSELAMTELKLLNNPHALPALIDHINAYIDSTEIPRDSIAGIGIGMPGFINAKEGINYTHLDSGGQSLTQLDYCENRCNHLYRERLELNSHSRAKIWHSQGTKGCDGDQPRLGYRLGNDHQWRNIPRP